MIQFLECFRGVVKTKARRYSGYMGGVVQKYIFFFCAIFFLAISAAIPQVQAKDLHGRVGIGYNAQFSNIESTGGVPGLSLKYGITRDIAVAGIVGARTSSPDNSIVGAKFFKNVFYETNLNFYLLIGGGIVTADTKTGAEFLGGFGSEFFIPGIESLGLSFEAGLSATNLSGTFILRTMGVSFLNAGIHFYF